MATIQLLVVVVVVVVLRWRHHEQKNCIQSVIDSKTQRTSTSCATSTKICCFHARAVRSSSCGTGLKHTSSPAAHREFRTSSRRVRRQDAKIPRRSSKGRGRVGGLLINVRKVSFQIIRPALPIPERMSYSTDSNAALSKKAILGGGLCQNSTQKC